MANKSLVFMLDVSGSMTANGKYDAVLTQMEMLGRVVLPNVNPPENVNLNIRIITFGSEVKWVYGDEVNGMPFNQFDWSQIKPNIPKPNGGTPIGGAIAKIVDMLYYGNTISDPDQLAPAIILISDGGPTDDYENQLKLAIEKKVGEESQGLFYRSLRTAIGIGVDEGARNKLKLFGHLSQTLRDQGLQTYYDVNDKNLSQLEDIIRSMTQGFTQNIPPDPAGSSHQNVRDQ